MVAIDLWDVIEEVADPEIPSLPIVDLGIVRSLEWAGDSAHVTITPTYSGCPAMDTIREDIASAFSKHGIAVEITTVLSPAWTTDWMTERGRQRLSEFGIAPPVAEGAPVLCPQCSSEQTKTLSVFGSTACKALWVCESCSEPFDHFKTL